MDLPLHTAPAPFLTAVRTIVADPAQPDLSMRQVAVLSLLDTEPLNRRHVRTLAQSLNLSRPAICRALNRLEDHLFATSHRGISDRRDRQSAITPQGRDWLRGLAATMGEGAAA